MIYIGRDLVIPLRLAPVSKNLYAPVVAAQGFKCYFPGSAGRTITNAIPANVANNDCGCYTQPNYQSPKKMCRLSDANFNNFYQFGFTSTNTTYSFYQLPTIDKNAVGSSPARGSENIEIGRYNWVNASSGRRFFNAIKFTSSKAQRVKFDLSVVVSTAGESHFFANNPTDIRCFLLTGSVGNWNVYPFVLQPQKQMSATGNVRSLCWWNWESTTTLYSGDVIYVTLPFVTHQLQNNFSGFALCNFYYALKED